MALTENDLKHFGMAADEIWKARVLKEKLIAANWSTKWNWMLEEYKYAQITILEYQVTRMLISMHM